MNFSFGELDLKFSASNSNFAAVFLLELIIAFPDFTANAGINQEIT